MSRYTSADQIAQSAYAPSREQLAFDAHAKAVEDLVREMRLITQVGYNWPSKGADRIARMRELCSDAERELVALSLDGARPGTPVAGIVAPQPITSKVVQLKAAE